MVDQEKCRNAKRIHSSASLHLCISGRSNISLAVNLILLVLGMLALSYAAVPLYRLFCQTTGYGGTTQESSQAPSTISNRVITVRFNADIERNIPWKFAPGEAQKQVKIGEQSITHFSARNVSDKAVTGRAMYNVIPFSAGAYFTKIACFCFKEQTLAPHQEVNMPVVFYIDPAILNDPEINAIKTITLSYTFFEVKK